MINTLTPLISRYFTLRGRWLTAEYRHHGIGKVPAAIISGCSGVGGLLWWEWEGKVPVKSPARRNHQSHHVPFKSVVVLYRWRGLMGLFAVLRELFFKHLYTITDWIHQHLLKIRLIVDKIYR